MFRFRGTNSPVVLDFLNSVRRSYQQDNWHAATGIKSAGQKTREELWYVHLPSKQETTTLLRLGPLARSQAVARSQEQSNNDPESYGSVSRVTGWWGLTQMREVYCYTLQESHNEQERWFLWSINSTPFKYISSLLPHSNFGKQVLYPLHRWENWDWDTVFWPVFSASIQIPDCLMPTPFSLTALNTVSY